jgi:pyruvate dehydrogenase E2 component (dihydrolipoamide acetyltransferase)
MAHPIAMSSFGDYAADGKLVTWLKPAGAKVEAGEAVAEIETEKAVYELQAAASGILHPVMEPGAELPLETIIGFVLEEGEAPPESSVGTGAILKNSSFNSRTMDSDRELRASPIAKRLAREYGVDLSNVVGSGPAGRIVEADVIAARTTPITRQRAGPSTLAKIRAQVPLTGMRKTIAHRMRQSLETAASVTITREVDAEILVAAHKRAELASGPIPYDALFVKLFADSLQERPELNAVIQENIILVLDDINIGFAVAVPGGGVVVPVVRSAASISLQEIAQITKRLRDRALAQQLSTEDVSGGTATISNLGAHNVDMFTPILNPPESVVLGIGRVTARATVRDGQVAAALTCVLSMTFDHRVADGVAAAQLLEAVAKHMTDPQCLSGLRKN